MVELNLPVISSLRAKLSGGKATRGAVLTLFLGVVLGAGCGKNFNGLPINPPSPASEIVGAMPDGSTFRLSEQRGKVVLLSFGYTYCPDVCPTTLSKLKGLYKKLGERAKEVAVVYVSVDPDRDTPERLGEYVLPFDARFYPVHIKGEALITAEAAYNIVATRRLPDLSRYPESRRGDVTYYSIDHTGGFQAIDKGGALRLRIRPEASVDELEHDVLKLLSE